ncbi:MAG TPA: DinB family protein [Acidisarcina sp.]|nr:DinB family protein [Acidisarcina sp.]
MPEDRILREQLVELLHGGSAHADAGTVLEDFPADKWSFKPNGAPWSSWQLLEHIRIALDDLLDFCRNPEYVAPKWPEEYWPKEESPANAEAWDKSVAAVLGGLQSLEHLIKDEKSNLFARIPWGDGQTLLREVLLAADHTSYHLGQIVLLRKQMNAWSG